MDIEKLVFAASEKKLYTTEEVQVIVSWAVSEALRVRGIQPMRIRRSPRRKSFNTMLEIEKLDESTRALIDSWIRDPLYTYARIHEELKGMGLDISKSAIGRYALTIK